MMEREFIEKKLKQFRIQEFIDESVGNAGHSHTVLKKTPLGEKIIIYANRPGIVVGRRGSNIKKLTKELKKNFDLENPQIEIEEVEDVYLDPNIVAEKIVSSLERFGGSRFKGIGHKTLSRIMDAGARGAEIVISGKVPGSRARRWRFYQGYVKKCGEAAQSAVRSTTQKALLKAGSVGVEVHIMPPGAKLPDDRDWIEGEEAKVEVNEESSVKKKKKETKEDGKEKSENNKDTSEEKKEADEVEDES